MAASNIGLAGTSALGSEAIPSPNSEARLGQHPVSEAEIKGYGMTVRIPLPKWAVAVIAAAVIAGLVVSGAYLTYAYVLNRVPVPRGLLDEYAETAKHSVDPKEQTEETVFTFPDSTRVTVIHYKNDGCNRIVRWIPALSKADGLWMFGPGLKPEKHISDVPGRWASSGMRHASMTTAPARKVVQAGLFPTWSPERSATLNEGQGRCLDPHPGQYREQRQQVGQCAVQVWRYFSDGCVHYQMYNPCSGTWDVWPNGAPHVYWQRCLH